MIASRTWKAFWAAAAFVATGVVGAPEALAGNNDGFDAQNFKIALDPYAYMTVNGARSLAPLQIHIQAETNYAKNPLKFTSDSTVSDRDILKEVAVLDMGASIGLFKLGEHGGLQFGASIPWNYYVHGLEFDQSGFHYDKDQFGDLRTQLKLTILDREDDIVGVAILAEANWPTGEASELTSDNKRPSYIGKAIVEKKFGAFRIGAEGGYEYVEGEIKAGGLQYDDKMHLGLGLGYEILENLQVVGEVYHWTRIENPWDHEVESPFEGGLAVKYTGFIFGMLGVNAGLNNGLGAPDFRLIAAIGVTF